MSADDDIERQIMMEMEKEIQRNQGYGGFSAHAPPSFEISPMGEDLSRRAEDDRVQGEVEAQLRQKREEREARNSVSMSSPEDGANSPFRQPPAKAPPVASFDDFFQPTANSADNYGGFTTDPFTAAADPYELARQEAEDDARREAEEQARAEVEEEAREEAEEARREAEQEARAAAEEQARREAEAEALLQAEEEAREEAEAEARRQAEEEARMEAEEDARREAQEEARAEAQARREAEAEARRQAEEDAREQARRQAEQEARAAAAEQARREAEAEARRQAEEEVRAEAEEEAREQARHQAEQEARAAAEEQARREAEARRQAEEEARMEAEEDARRQAQEEACREAEAEARRRVEDEARRQAQEEAHREAEEQARRAAEEEALEEARRQVEQEAREEAEAEARREAEEQARREAEGEEAARREAEAKARRLAQEQARIAAEEQVRRAAEEEAREQARRQAEQGARAAAEAEEQARLQTQEDARVAAEASARRQAEENGRREAEERARQQAEVAARAEAESARRQSDAERLDEIRRQAREAVFREYAAKGLAKKASPTAIRVDPTVPSALTPLIANAASGIPDKSITSLSDSLRTDLSREHSMRAKSPLPIATHAHGSAQDNHRIATLVTSDFTGDADNDDDEDTGLEGGESGAVSDYGSDASHNSLCPPEMMRNENGILARGAHPLNQLAGQASQVAPLSKEERPLEMFEAQLESELHARGMASDAMQRSHIDVHRYGTIREPGKCLFPPEEIAGAIPPHAKIQLGFFTAKQTIIALQPIRRHATANRERACQGSERPLSSLTCFFESEVLQDSTLTVDDEDWPHNARSERLLTRDELMVGDGSAVEKAVSSVSYGDPLQVWERVHMSGFTATEEAEEGGAVSKKKAAVTTNNLWVSDVDIHKPIPAMRTFTGAFLLCVQAHAIGSQVVQLHGEGTDPLIVAIAFYSVSDTQKLKVSETFYFDSGLDVFYPQKERRELAKDNKVVALIPNEFRGTLQLVVRVYRPCCENFDDYMDLYSRADKYKPVHVAPMKQETLLLTQVSDVFEEIGWMAAPCQADNKLLSAVNMTSVYRRPMSDVDLLKMIPDERSRGVLRAVPIRMEFRLSDLTKHEAAFPSDFEDPRPQENEWMVSLLNPDVQGARAQNYRYVPCCIPILNSGYFTTYDNVYYFRMSRMKVVNSGSLRNFPSSHHTYVLQICVKEKDDSLSEEGAIKCIYGRGLNNLTLDTTAWSSAVHASPDTPLSDEVKIQLPLNLTDNHHIFFTLHATHQKKSAPNASQPRSFKVAYAAFPLMVNNTVQTRESIEIKFVAFDQAAVAGAGGYLSNFAKAPVSALLNGGEPVVYASAQTKTTVHASNRSVASVFKQCPESIGLIKRNDKVLAVSGQLHTLDSSGPDPHRNVISLINQLPLAEILAFFPFISAYAFSLIGSASTDVSLVSRMHMLDTFIGVTQRAQQYDTNTHTIRRRHGVISMASVFPRTSAGSILYHFLSNDTLYEGKDCTHKSRLYAGLAETWYHLLTVAKQSGNPAPAPAAGEASPASPASPTSPAGAKKPAVTQRNLLREMSELSWFLFDAILRSVYIWAEENSNTSRTEMFDASFYTVAGDLCVRVLEKLSTYDESVIVKRVALFVRGLMRYCDRGRVLMICEKVIDYFDGEGNGESMTNFIRYVLEDPDAVALLLPSANEARPVFLSKLLVAAFSTLLLHSNRETRCIAGDVLYNFLLTLTNDPKVPSDTLTGVASQFFALALNVSTQWKSFLQMSDKAPAPAGTNDKRQVAMIVLWIVYYTPRRKIFAWLQNEPEAKTLAGLMHVVSDAQSLFRYSSGEDKCRKPDLTPEEAAQVKAWDGRNTTFVTAIGAQLVSFFLLNIPNVLCTVRDDKSNPCVFPFFVMLESVLNLGNSTVSLQMSSAAIQQAVCQLFPEIISRKARMSNGMVLLTFRLMSSCCQYVRSFAGSTFLFMSQAFFSWKSSLSKIKSMTANALVSVAESKMRDLRLAGRLIEFQFDELIERARAEEARYRVPASSVNFANRYEDDSNAAGGDAQMKYNRAVPELFTSTKRTLPISRYLLDKAASHQPQGQSSDVPPPRFSEEFAAMTSTVLSLFDDVLRLQVDDSMKFKEARIFAYFEVFRNFIRQNALKEALKWLHRLHDAHKANNDHVEAGMVLVFIAALCFRVTEVFYFIKGRDTKGARMPYGVFTHVYWQDYVRILPEVETLLSADTVYAIVSELYVCPDDPCFTMEGQVLALKEAAELQDKGQYYEYSLPTIALVDLYLRAQQDYKGCGIVHTAQATWCKTISDRVKRETNRYYMLWARMEREEPNKLPSGTSEQELADNMIGEKPRGLPSGKAIQRIYKMPPNHTVAAFKDYAKAYIESLFPDSSLVKLTDDLTDTQPALPEPDTKRKRVAAVHRPPNHCWLTVTAVQPHFPDSTRISLPDGFDKTVHITYFRNVMHLLGGKHKAAEPSTGGGQRTDIMSQRMSIGTYELDRAFPATTTAIDISQTHQVLLDPFETTQETVNTLRERIVQAPESPELICVMRDALSVNGLPPGGYMKEAIAVMGDHPEVIHSIRSLNALVHKKMEVCNKVNAIAKHPEDYALVLKAVTDIECGIIAMQTSDDILSRDD